MHFTHFHSNRIDSNRIDLKRFGRKKAQNLKNRYEMQFIDLPNISEYFNNVGALRLQRYNAVNAAHKRYERFQRKTNRNVFDRYESYEINYENRLQRLLLT